MKVLVACECSGRVREAFRRHGHDAWSCDVQKSDDNSPFHILGDAVEVVLRSGWDLIVAHPPCTYLCNSGVQHLSRTSRKLSEKGLVGKERRDALAKAAGFFLAMFNAPCRKVAVENPIMHGHAMALVKVKHSQTFQPYDFGDRESKRTCLWLRGLPLLKKTKIVTTFDQPILFPEMAVVRPDNNRWDNQSPSGAPKSGGPTASKIRSTTYKFIAEAMAEQWGKL